MPFAKRITSTQNAQVKGVVRLRDKKARDTTKLTIVDGFRELVCAQQANVHVQELYFCPDLVAAQNRTADVKRLSAASDEVFEVTKPVFAKLAFGDRLDGVVAVCRQPRRTLESVPDKNNPLFVVIEKLEKPGNLGAILRTCDAAGVDGLIVCEGITDMYNPNVIRASIGTVFSVTVVSGSNADAYKFLKKKDVAVCVTSPAASLPYTDARLIGACAVVLGSEQHGVSDFWLKNADIKIAIPMQGKADSLNVSNAAAIVIFEAVRQRTAHTR